MHSDFPFLFAEQEVGGPVLEGHQTDATHSVFTTSPAAYDKEHTTAAPESRDQERKEKFGRFDSMNSFFLQLNL